MGEVDDHYLSHLEIWAKYMHKPHALGSEITKKSLQPIDGRKEGVKICIFVPFFFIIFNGPESEEDQGLKSEQK